MKKQRDQLVDVLKGIGIISVVIGHSGVLLPGMENVQSIVFVYLYHLMLFFFAAGMVFHPEKCPDPYIQIGKTIGSMIPMCVSYNLVFALLHNLIVWAQLRQDQFYSLGEIAKNCLYAITLNYTDPIVGALWFVPMFLVGKSMFFVFYHYADKMPHRWLFHSTVIIGTGVFAVILNDRSIFLPWNLQTALLGIPVMYIGHLFNRYRAKLQFVKNPLTLLLSVLLMCLFIGMKVGYIELSKDYIISPILFYPVTLLGMVFCVSLGEQILKNKNVTTVVSYLGSISFHIMAIHFVVFKVFDRMYGYFFDVEPTKMMAFPTAFTNIGLVYTVVGLAGSVAFVKISEWVIRIIKTKLGAKTNKMVLPK